MFCHHHLREINDHELLEHLAEHYAHLKERVTMALNDIQTELDGFGDTLASTASSITGSTGTLSGELAGKVDTTKLAAGVQAITDAAASLATLAAPAPTEPGTPVTTAARTEYTFTGADPSTIDAAQWTAAGLAADGTTQLYTFAGDLNPGDATGASADWAVYTAPAATA